MGPIPSSACVGTADLVGFAAFGDLSGLLVFDGLVGFFIAVVVNPVINLSSWEQYKYTKEPKQENTTANQACNEDKNNHAAVYASSAFCFCLDLPLGLSIAVCG